MTQVYYLYVKNIIKHIKIEAVEVLIWEVLVVNGHIKDGCSNKDLGIIMMNHLQSVLCDLMENLNIGDIWFNNDCGYSDNIKKNSKTSKGKNFGKKKLVEKRYNINGL